MKFDQIPNGSRLFVDANTLIYHFSGHPKYGAACTNLIKRIENQQVEGYSSAHSLADVAHRLMTIEAIAQFSWPARGIVTRLRKHFSEIPKLLLYRQSVAAIPQLGIQVLSLSESVIQSAVQICSQHEMLTDDGIIIAVMQQHGITQIASADGDFDRVVGILRYGPI